MLGLGAGGFSATSSALFPKGQTIVASTRFLSDANQSLQAPFPSSDANRSSQPTATRYIPLLLLQGTAPNLILFASHAFSPPASEQSLALHPDLLCFYLQIQAVEQWASTREHDYKNTDWYICSKAWTLHLIFPSHC